MAVAVMMSFCILGMVLQASEVILGSQCHQGVLAGDLGDRFDFATDKMAEGQPHSYFAQSKAKV